MTQLLVAKLPCFLDLEEVAGQATRPLAFHAASTGMTKEHSCHRQVLPENKENGPAATPACLPTLAKCPLHPVKSSILHQDCSQANPLSSEHCWACGHRCYQDNGFLLPPNLQVQDQLMTKLEQNGSSRLNPASCSRHNSGPPWFFWHSWSAVMAREDCAIKALHSKQSFQRSHQVKIRNISWNVSYLTAESKHAGQGWKER